MFKLTCIQLKKNWAVLFGVFLALLLSSILLSTFSLLLTNSIYAITLGAESHLKNPTVPIALFGTMVGISFFISILALYSAIMISVKMRWHQFIRLRIIGATNQNLRNMIFLENILISILTIIIGLIVGYFLSNAIILYLQNNNVLERNFMLYEKFKFQWIYILLTVILVILITFLATMPLRNISISKFTNPFNYHKKLSLFFRFLIGFIFIAGAIVLSTLKPILFGGLGQGMIILALFCYFIGLGLIGQWIVKWIITIVTRIGPIVWRTACLSIKFNLPRLFLPVLLIASLSGFINYAVNTFTIYNSIIKNNNEQLYKNVKNLLLKTDMNKASNYQDVINLYHPNNNNFISNLMPIVTYQNGKDLKSKQLLSYGVTGEKLLLNIGVDNTIWNNFQKNPSQPNVIIIDTSEINSNSKTIKLHFNNPLQNNNGIDLDFNVLACSKLPNYALQGLPAILFNGIYVNNLFAKTFQTNLIINSILSDTDLNPLSSDYTSSSISHLYIGENGENTNRAFMILFAIVIAVFNGLISLNSIIQYFISERKEARWMRVLGITNYQLLKNNTIKGIIIAFFGVIFGLIATIYTNANYSAANGLPTNLLGNTDMFWIIYISIFACVVLISIILSIYLAMQKPSLK